MVTKKDSFFFVLIKHFLKKKGMWEVSPEILTKIWQEAGLIPPDSDRVVDVSERVSFICFIREYTVWVHTSFNRKTREFTKKAALSIVVSKMVDGGGERVITRFIHRDTDDFTERLFQYVSFILKELRENWPLTNKNEWSRLKEFPCDQFFWIAKNGRKIRNFFGKTSDYPLVKKAEADRFYYHKFLRKRRKVKLYRRNIRKPYRRRRRRK